MRLRSWIVAAGLVAAGLTVGAAPASRKGAANGLERPVLLGRYDLYGTRADDLVVRGGGSTLSVRPQRPPD